MEQSRRQFIQTSIAGVTGLSLASNTLAQTNETPGSMPTRKLGRLDERVSLLGMGGYHIGLVEEAEAIRMIQEAVDEGISFMDCGWEYNAGLSEHRMGKALEGRRENVFQMTKHHGREKEMAMIHLEDSLRRLKTDVIDLWMFHECIYEKDPDRIFAKGGGIEAAELAKQQGKVRFIGFTGHRDPHVHLKMLAQDYPWDAVLMPLSILDGNYKSFEKSVLPVLIKRGIAPLAMKTRASGTILKEGLATVEECWRYVASLPVSVIISGMTSLHELRDNLRMARQLTPMTDKEKTAILDRTRKVALTGKEEPFKSTTNFDSPIGQDLYGLRG